MTNGQHTLMSWTVGPREATASSASRTLPPLFYVSNPKFVVREAREADADVITTVHEADWRAGYTHLFSQHVLKRAIQEHCSRWARVLANTEFDNTTLLVLEHRQQIIGFWALATLTDLASYHPLRPGTKPIAPPRT
jgi:hypothetical protein